MKISNNYFDMIKKRMILSEKKENCFEESAQAETTWRSFTEN